MMSWSRNPRRAAAIGGLAVLAGTGVLVWALAFRGGGATTPLGFMIVGASQLSLPPLRDDPADAEAASHRLLVRGGFIRQVTAGVWTFLPLGWRVHRKIEQIVREEMDAIGSQEMFAPVLTPAELWQRTG